MAVPTAALIEGLTAVVERTFPLRGPAGSIELHPMDLGAQTMKLTPLGPFVLSEWGLLLSVRTNRDGFEPLDISPVIVEEEHFDDPRVLAHIEGWWSALSEAISQGDPAIVTRYSYRFTVTPSLPLVALDLGSTAAEYRAKALEFPWLGRYSRALPKKAPGYQLAPREYAMRDDRVEFGRISEWINFFTERTFEDARWDDAMIRSMPDAVRALDGAAYINEMVGGNGFEVFLAQTRGATIRHCYSALAKVGAPRLRAVMEKGIALAARQGAEFMSERSTAWVDRFSYWVGDWSELDGWDEGHTYWLIENELIPAANAYANRHRAALVRD